MDLQASLTAELLAEKVSSSLLPSFGTTRCRLISQDCDCNIHYCTRWISENATARSLSDDEDVKIGAWILSDEVEEKIGTWIWKNSRIGRLRAMNAEV